MTSDQQPTRPTTTLEQRLNVDFALQAAGLGIWEYDPASNQVLWDERCRALFGLTANNRMTYEQAFKHIHPDDVARVDQATQWVMSPQSDGVFDQTYRTIGVDDGKLRWVRCQGRAYFTQAGELTQFGGIAQDVTSQTLNNQQAEQNQQHLLHQFEQAPVGIATISGPALTFRSANPFYAQLVGRLPQQLIDRPLLEALPELAGQGFDELLRTVMTTGVAYSASEVAATLVRQHGPEIIYVNLTYQPQPPVDDQEPSILVIATDVTSQVSTRRKIEDSEARFRSLVEEAPVATCLFVGRALRIEVANEAMIQVWGKGPEVLGQPLADALPELRNQHFLTTLDELFITGQSLSTKAGRADLVVNGQLRTFYFDYDFKPLRDSQGAIYAILETAIDVTQQVLDRQQLIESEARFRALVEQAPVAVALFEGPQFVITSANERVLEYWGRQREQVMDKPLFEALPEASGQGFEELLTGVLTTGERFVARELSVMLERNGQLERTYIDFVYEPFRSIDGRITAVMVVANEITEQVLARQKLAASEARFRAFIRDAPVAMLVYEGPHQVMVEANQEMLAIFGRGDSVVGKPLLEGVPELRETPLPGNYQRVLATGETYHHPAAPVTLVKDGQSYRGYYNYTYKALFDQQDRVYGVVCTAIDVTQQVEAQQTQQNQQARQRFLLQLSDSLRLLSDPLAIYYQAARLVGEHLGANRVGYAEDQNDGQTIVVLRNYVQGVADLQGRYPYADYGPLLGEFMAGRTIVRSDIAHDASLTEAQKQAHRLLQLGATVNKPLLQNGRLVAVLFVHYQDAHAWSPDELNLLDEVAERLVAAVGRAQAEVALRQSDEQLRQLSADLERQVQQRTGELAAANTELASNLDELAATNTLLTRSNENLQTFSYIASHDLQEPLRKIQQFGDILKTRLTDSISSEELGYLERMQSAASRMSTLIRDLLSYSRISTQRSDDEVVSLAEVVRDVLDTLDLAIGEAGAQINVEGLPTLMGSAVQLEQLFQNLLANALKFRRPDVDPRIRISSQRIDAADLPAQIKPTRRTDYYERIDVADNGIGFDELYLDRIFQVFQRLHGKSQYTGTGVGLAICEKIVTNHGGVLTASSQPGQGATFTIYLPVLT